MPKTSHKSRSIQKSRSQKNRKISPRMRSVLKVFGTSIVVGIVLVASGFAFAATQEQHDSFCSSCHTQPESTFYQRSIATSPVDLASAHIPDKTRCIDCHSGVGITGRMKAELLGAHNALAFYSGTAVQPAKLTHPIGDENCLKCHQNTVSQANIDINNHFHAFLPRWQAVDPNAAKCVTCHAGHSTDGEASIAFLNRTTTQGVCESCHRALGAGD
jgi:Doubled CXXCH motif (Paired_CXXCH_1)